MWAKWIIVNYVRIWGIVTWNVNELFLSMRWLESPTKLFNAIRCARCYSKHWAYNNKIMLSTKQWRIQKKMQLTYKKKQIEETREKEIKPKSTSGARSCFEACLYLKKLCIPTTNHAIYATHFSHWAIFFSAFNFIYINLMHKLIYSVSKITV